LTLALFFVFIFLWTLEFFYSGHVKKPLYNTIQYNSTINKYCIFNASRRLCHGISVTAVNEAPEREIW